MSIDDLKTEFSEFYKDKIFTITFGEDIVTDKTFLKIYKNNLSLEEQYNVLTKILDLKLNENENIKILIFENVENKMNGNYNGTFEMYYEDVKYKYEKHLKQL